MKGQWLLLLIAVGFVACQPAEPPATEIEMPEYPETRVEMTYDTLYGQVIEDGYRYLQDLDDAAVEQWYRDHSDRARLVLDAISGRQWMLDKLNEFDQRRSVRAYSTRYTDTDRFYYLKQTPEDETGKLFYRDGFEGDEHLLFDPDQYEPESEEAYVISAFYPSPDGKKVAFEVAPNGSESSVLHIINVETGELYPEQIDRSWFASCSWLPGNESFVFNRLRSSDVHDMDREKDSKVYIHTVGQDPSTDVEFFSRENNPDLGILPEEFPLVFYDSDCERIFGGGFSVDNRMQLYMAPVSAMESGDVDWQLLFTKEEDIHDIRNSPTHMYLYTPKGAPNFQILKMPLDNPDITQAEVVVPEFEDMKIASMDINGEGLYFTATRNGVEARVFRLDLETEEITEIELPAAAGSANVSTRGCGFDDIWIGISGWTMDFTRYRYDHTDGSFTEEMLSTQAEYPEYANLTVEEVMVTSHDGVKVPLSIIYNKDVERNGANPTLLYGYGAYGITIDPGFSPALLLWTAQGGILAIPHVRGGGELGDSWHRAGQKTTKPNTWKDLIACTEYMISENYTSSEHVAIMGGSAGGILIGRAMTERPDLFAAAIPLVGCLNPLYAEESPNGPVNVPEFGTIQDSVECMALMEMDAFLHLEEGVEYPATYITAGMNDPRVIAWQPGKFAARLTACNASDEPVLFYTDFEAGHGIGDSKTKSFESLTDQFSFALWQTGHPEFQVTEFPGLDQ